MADFKYILEAVPYTPTATSEDSNYPVTNLSVYGNLLRCWKATVATGIVNVTLDFGAGNTFASLAADPGLFLDDLNVTSLYIQGNTVTTDWVTPPWSQAVTITKHEGATRYKDFRRLADLSASAFTYRYCNLRIPSQTPTDGGNYRIGRVWPGTVGTLLQNPGYDSDLTIEQDVIETPFLGGGSETSIMGPPYAMLTLPRTISTTAARDQQWVLDAIGRGVPFVLWDAGEGNTHDGWLVKRIEATSLHKQYLAYYTSRWVLREVI